MDWLSVIGIVVAVVVGIWILLYLYGAHLRRTFDAMTPEEQELELVRRAAQRDENLARKGKRIAQRAERAHEREARRTTKQQQRAEGQSHAAAERERRAALRTARKPLLERKSIAERDYTRRVREAERVFRGREDEIERRFKATEDEVAVAEKVGRQRVARFSGLDGSVEAFENSITINGKTFVMNTSVRAGVDMGGNFFKHSRSTLTRMTAGGLLLGPVGILAGGMVKKSKTHDMRELYLLIEGDEFAAAITCNPDRGPAARHTAAAINQAAKTSAGLEGQRSEGISSAQEALQAALKVRARDLARANAELTPIRAQRHELDKAIAALDQFDSDHVDRKVEQVPIHKPE
jgi:hypothetical protein